MLCCVVLCCVVLCCVVLSYVMLCCVLCCAVLCCVELCYVMLICAVLCCFVLCCAVLCYVLLLCVVHSCPWQSRAPCETWLSQRAGRREWGEGCTSSSHYTLCRLTRSQAESPAVQPHARQAIRLNVYFGS